MPNCLGIYLSSNIVKYAKIFEDSSKKIKLEEYGVRFVKDNQKATLKNIIEETNSQNIPIAINPQNSKFLNFMMFDQAQRKAYEDDIAKMEFEAWCEKNGKSPEKYKYIYKIADIKNSENKYNGVLNFVEKANIEEFLNIDGYTISSMLPSQFSINRLVPEDEKNYLLVNLDDILSTSVVIEGKLLELKYYDIGMRNILDEFSIKLGSYQKAYEACRQLNVYSDESTNNDRDLEIIAEPILQEILRNVAIVLNKNRNEVDKVFITGTGITFTNIDILFKEYLNIKCDILKPDFIQDTSDVRNMAEILETTQAMAIAIETLSPVSKSEGFVTASGRIKSKVNNFDWFKSNKQKTGKDKVGSKKENTHINLDGNIIDKTIIILNSCSIISILAICAYITFSIVYTNNVSSMSKQIDQKIQEINIAKSKVDTDISYINTNMNKYKEVNDQVSGIVKEIETNSLGTSSVYNVAAFMQNIIKIIPTNVQLKTIKSDDNKNVVITAQSNSYASLGYFLSELKLKQTLKNIKVNTVNNGTTTVIEIGGELP